LQPPPLPPLPTGQTLQQSNIHDHSGVQVGGPNEGGNEGPNEGGGAVGVAAFDAADVALTP